MYKRLGTQNMRREKRQNTETMEVWTRRGVPCLKINFCLFNIVSTVASAPFYALSATCPRVMSLLSGLSLKRAP